MTLLLTLLSYFVYFGSFLAFLLAVQQILGRKRELANFLRFGHLVVNSVMLYGNAFLANKIPVEHPLAMFPYFTCGFLLGPTYLFSISSLLGTRTGLKKTDVLHFVPALVVLAGEIVFQAQDTVIKRDIFSVLLTTPFSSPLAPLVEIAVIVNIIYEFLVWKDVFPFWNNPQIRREARIVSIRVLASFLALALFTAGVFSANSLLILLGGAVHGSIMISIFVAQEYYPQFFFALKREIRRKRYERSLLTGLNTEVIRNRLEELMKDEQLYKDMEISLQGLADRLSLTPHQLSQFLNDEMGMNFRNYVNGFRVKEAQYLLEHRPEMSISSICYEVGFNSKSTFNTVFKEVTSRTPREYREQLSK